MPKLWKKTIEDHRRSVHEAVLDTTAALATEHGLRAVTMSRVAETTGIGRATLYKYFPDVEAILHAWHDRQVAAHLAQLAQARASAAKPGDRLEAVLERYALIQHASHAHPGSDLAALLHGDDKTASAHRQLWTMIAELLAEAAKSGSVRDDVAPGELASYCLHALGAASQLPSKPAVRRLVRVTIAGLAPPA